MMNSRKFGWLMTGVACLFVLGPALPQMAWSQTPGDANGDGRISYGDVTVIVNQILGLGTSPGIPDCNSDGQVDIRDVVCLINILSTLPPPDPGEVAPPVDPTVATNLFAATEFLYTTGIQTGVEPGTIEAKRAAVLRGKVLDRDGAPLSGVSISVLNHPEFGQTLSRTDGMFDLAVNGGGYLTVRYRRSGYLEIQRQIRAPWQNYVRVPDVVLLPVDPAASAIDFSAPIQVARGSLVADSRGTRQSTLLFAGGTSAQAVFADGSSQPLPVLTVRATEYTVGDRGPEAMPGELPPGVAYTYAVELSVDEAAGAASVEFDRPVNHYVDNFLGFATGEPVPAYYYDRSRGVWVLMEGGKVIAFLGSTGGFADLDTDGDGLADGSAVLESLGITDAERQALAGLYSAGQSFWRVPLTHFTPVDYNWPYTLPPDATPPSPPSVRRDESDPCVESGSILECQNRVLGERIPVTGTPFTLNYRSNRVPGNLSAYTVDIPLTGETPPLSLVDVRMVVDIAGRHTVETFQPSPNLSYRYTWDGRDIYDRPVQGRQPLRVRIGYTYIASYNCFGGGCPGNIPQTQWTEWTGSLGPWDGRSWGLGGWSLDVHHAYDPVGRELLLGSGERRSGSAEGPVITDHVNVYTSPSWARYSLAVTAGPDDSLFVTLAERWSGVLLARPGEPLQPFAGTGVEGFSGDGGPATQAQLRWPEGLALAPDGSVYISDTLNHRVRKVDLNGIISTVAGDGVAGFSGDNGPATTARLNRPGHIAVGPDGSVFVVDRLNERVRRIRTDGLIETALLAPLTGGWSPVRTSPAGIAVDGEGSLYASFPWSSNIPHPWGNTVVRKKADGVTEVVAGRPTCRQWYGEPASCEESLGYDGDGGPATQAQLNQPAGLAVGPDGSLYIADNMNYRIRWVDPTGIITTVAGIGSWEYWPPAGCDYGYGGPATAACLPYPSYIAMGAGGELYIGNGQRSIRRIAPGFPGLGIGEIPVASESGDELHIFDLQGRHQQTLNTLTNATVRRFRYNASGLLTQVEDASGNLTVIERDGAGRPAAIVSPYGQRTVLTADTDGYLSGITNPAGELRQFVYASGGLLTSATDPGGNASTYLHDAQGNLTRANDPAGGYQTLNRTEITGGYEVTRTTAMDRRTTYRVERLSTGDLRWLNTRPDGNAVETLFKTDGTQVTTHPDGTIFTTQKGPDPRFGMQSPIVKSLTVTTPGSLTYTLSGRRTATLDNPGDPLSLTSLTDTRTINGRTFTQVYNYDGDTRTVARTTPVGRVRTDTLDAQGRILQRVFGGIEPVVFSYDDEGRLASAVQGAGENTRSFSFSYGADGRLAQRVNPLSQATTFAYDGAGRVARLILPDSTEVLLSYDPRSYLNGITPPGRPVHQFIYTDAGRLAQYIPPLVGSGPMVTTYNYNLDRKLTQVQRPEGTVLALIYNTAGRLSTITQPRGVLTYNYNTATGNLSSIAAPGGEGLAFTFDGSMPTQTAWSGTVNGSLENTYDNNFRTVSRSVNGSQPITFTYDNDGLLTRAGTLSLSRNAQNGLLTGTTLENVIDTITYNGFGERSSYSANHSASPLLEIQYTRDRLGRITQKSETIEATTHTYNYTYDPVGRLTRVLRDGSPLETYTYDGNGNRLTANGVVSTFDNQDRLIQAGATTFSHTTGGDLASRIQGTQTTTFSYDLMGNLMQVGLPDGTLIEYVIDGFNRRIGKKVDGNLVKGFLYKDQLGVVAELDQTGTMVSRFVYGSMPNVPDYMIRDGISYRILSDHLGSVRLVVNAGDGTIVQRMDYDSFGRVITDTSPGFQPFGFAGGLYDPDTGLTRFGARDYDADAGRWTTKDPIGFRGGSTNLYRYALNDPVNFLDLTGLATNASFPGAPLDPSIPAIVATELTDMIVGISGLDAPTLGTGIGREIGEVIHEGTIGMAEWQSSLRRDLDRTSREVAQLQQQVQNDLDQIHRDLAEIEQWVDDWMYLMDPCNWL
jgi:RHS repeat-associated protein